jgi:hypothetical protein
MSEDWKAIEEQAKRDFEAISDDQDAVAYIVKYFAKDLHGRYLSIYRSDRYDMGRTPKQAVANLLRLPPLE